MNHGMIRHVDNAVFTSHPKNAIGITNLAADSMTVYIAVGVTVACIAEVINNSIHHSYVTSGDGRIKKITILLVRNFIFAHVEGI